MSGGCEVAVCDCEVEVRVRGDAARADSVKRLLSRAVHLEFRIVADKVKFEQSITVHVSYTGCGIPADILPHVLEPFFTTKLGKGTGLGLSISHAYVRSHGGEIHVESLPGRGTTVRFTLPIRQEGRTVSETEEVVA